MGKQPDARLVALLAKAHDWFERLRSGQGDGVVAIAREEKVDRSYMRRVAYVVFLDPEIVQRIVADGLGGTASAAGNGWLN